MKLKKFVQIMISLVAVCGTLYIVSQNEIAMWIVAAFCVALVSAIGVLKLNAWIFSPDVPKEPKPEKIKTPKHKKVKKVEKAVSHTDIAEPIEFEDEFENQCDLCDAATCKGCELYEKNNSDYDIDDIVKEFNDAADELAKNTSFSVEDLT